MKKLIGITGKARAGKDTMAEYLQCEFGFVRLPFADPLKMAAQNIFGLTDAQTWDDEVKETKIDHWGMSPREIFQKLGTEAVKGTFGSEVWIKRWMITYELIKGTDTVVVPDVRFDLEASVIRSRGGIIVEIRRGTGLEGETAQHVSEQGLTLVPDFVIENFGTKKELYASLDALVEGTWK